MAKKKKKKAKSKGKKSKKKKDSSSGKKGSSEKLEAIKMAMDQIEKQYGKGSIMRLGEKAEERLKVDSVPTGSVALDLALGVGGLPRGRIVEIYGPEASGKTTVALHIVAEAQKKGGQAAFVDAEHALDPAWAETIGVDLDDLLLSQPDSGEQALEITETLLRSGALDVIVVDSVAALVPRAELEGEMGDASIGVQARLMSQALRKLTGAISKSKTILIFTNQIRHKIGVMFGNPETTSGGLALKFYSSVRIDVRRIETLKDGDNVIGTRHRARVVKNKVAPPLRVAEFDILGDEGISKAAGLLDVAVDLNLVERKGSFYNYDGETLAQGRLGTIEHINEEKKLAEELEKKIREVVTSGGKVPKELGEAGGKKKKNK